jgi:sec-independent protein translocase protein TatC
MKPAALVTHFLELRRRLFYSLAVMGLAMMGAYALAPDIYAFLVRPLAASLDGENRRLIYTGLTEAFLTYLRLSFWSAAMVTCPFILAQIWLFIAPGLYRSEKRAVFPFLIATPLLFWCGAAFAYYVVFPAAWHFFLGFEHPATPGGLPIQLEARVSEYLSLVTGLVFAFGVAFELPVLLLLLVRLGIIDATGLAAKRRYAILMAFIVAAVLTPPDVLSQLLLAIPLIILYELSILAARLTGPSAKPRL